MMSTMGYLAWFFKDFFKGEPDMVAAKWVMLAAIVCGILAMTVISAARGQLW